MRVTGVVFAKIVQKKKQGGGMIETEIMQVSIHARKNLIGTSQPVNLVTPSRLAQVRNDTDTNTPLSATTLDRLEKVCAEVKRYIAGERAQGELFE